MTGEIFEWDRRHLLRYVQQSHSIKMSTAHIVHYVAHTNKSVHQLTLLSFYGRYSGMAGYV